MRELDFRPARRLPMDRPGIDYLADWRECCRGAASRGRERTVDDDGDRGSRGNYFKACKRALRRDL